MSLLPFIQWCYSSPIGEGIRNSTWLFPVIEAFHLVGFGLTAGAALTVDLRLLGVGLSKQSAAQLSAAVTPWMVGSVTLMAISGTLLFLSESIKCYYSFAFWVKMICLLLVIIFSLTVRRSVVQNGQTLDRHWQSRLTGIVSLTLWFGVAWGGRWIGFS